jgi:hypothetical protein
MHFSFQLPVTSYQGSHPGASGPGDGVMLDCGWKLKLEAGS